MIDSKYWEGQVVFNLIIVPLGSFEESKAGGGIYVSSESI